VWACGCAEPAAPTTIDTRVVPLVGDVVADDATVSVQRAGNEGVTPGAIVISSAGDGLIRGVAAIHDSGDRLVLDTVPASLEDAVIDGDVAGSLALSDGKADTYGLGRISYDVRDREVLSNDYLAVTVTHASFTATPTIDLDLSMRHRSLEHFAAVLNGQLDASLDVEIAAREGITHPTIPLWKSTPQVFVQWVGLVPVVETATLSVGLRLDTTARGEASVHLRGEAHIALSGGVTYDAGDGFSPVATFDHSLSIDRVTGTRLDDIDVRAYLYTQVDVKFYGIAGPFIDAGPYIDTHGRAGVFAEVGGSIKAFGLDLPAMPRYTLFDRATQL
jgi:hypothetical protein